jgi:low affinity Fe/Cu permease
MPARRKTPPGRESLLERLSFAATQWTGSSAAFAAACGVILAWLVTGPIFRFSDTWQLVINTGTTIVTFLMVFLIQRAQNKESRAIQLKLNELVAALEGASNRLVNVEDLSEGELKTLRRYYGRLSRIAEREESLTESHSVEEAERRHQEKEKAARGKRS